MLATPTVAATVNANGAAPAHIAPQLRALVVPIDSVELHPRNPRRGDVAATWIPRVELDRVDGDDEGAQLGRDVGGRSAVGVDGGCYGGRG